MRRRCNLYLNRLGSPEKNSSHELQGYFPKRVDQMTPNGELPPDNRQSGDNLLDDVPGSSPRGCEADPPILEAPVTDNRQVAQMDISEIQEHAEVMAADGAVSGLWIALKAIGSS